MATFPPGEELPPVVEPVLASDDSGRPLPEVIISVVDEARGTGVGRRLMEALMQRAHAAGHAGLTLTVSERNPVALRLYEGLGFERLGRTPTGLVTMLWSS
jgi:GNAT superfamily N-acetyltransferase